MTCSMGNNFWYFQLQRKFIENSENLDVRIKIGSQFLAKIDTAEIQIVYINMDTDLLTMDLDFSKIVD